VIFLSKSIPEKIKHATVNQMFKVRIMISKCPICSSDRKVSFRQTILKQHIVEYLFCDYCGFLQTETPYWLEEAYSSAISQADTGLLSRNISISQKLICLLSLYFDKNTHYLDIAGGYGTLTRLMRDAGFNFYWQDIYCKNLLASGFEKPDHINSFAAVTAFEVLEHITNPIEFVRNAFEESKTSTMIFSTELFVGQPPKPEDWWYYQFATGQHVSFYQYKTLECIAQKLSLHLYSHKNLHMLTTKPIHNPIFFHLMAGKLGRIAHVFFRQMKKSKTFQDHLLLMNT
jgi:hypothetical protein